MDVSAAARSVWGKLDRSNASMMPLVTHLEHAAAMAGHLWDFFFPASLKRLIMQDLACTESEARSLYRWFAGTHDVGKVSVFFAQQAESQGMNFVLDRMRDAGLATARLAAQHKVRHEVVSQLAIRDWLMERFGMARGPANTWSCVAGGHHGKNPTAPQVTAADKQPLSVGQGRWHEVRMEILDAVAEATESLPLLADRAHMRLPVRTQALLTSMVVVADWLASNQELIPYRDDLSPSDRAALAFDELNLPSPWSPSSLDGDAAALLWARFPDLRAAAARRIQRHLVEAARNIDGPGLLILEAPMGGGKTEAALMAAEVLAARFGQGGVYFGLPTMATANPMFARTLGWLKNTLGDEDASVALAHGKAGLNDLYAGMVKESWQGHVYDDGDPDQGRPIVNSWLRGRRRAGLANFVVGTIDQALFAALKSKYVALRHLSVAGKVVIVDEVHAADLYMREYLKRALTWLGTYGSPVILMSATLPPTQREEYVAAYARGRGIAAPRLPDVGDSYPRITVFDGAARAIPVPDETVPVTLHIRRIHDGVTTLQEILSESLAGGGCAGVICNTVARAQTAYRSLREVFGADVVLLHSRFLAPDRADREQQVVSQLGRGSKTRPRRLIVVGTQVLEQSLDVDFDIMVTDLAPVDLVLQRVGRLHRHERESRPDAVASPMVYLRGVSDWQAVPPKPDRGSRAVYGSAALLRSAAVLHGRDSITLPMDIPALVREAYSPDLTPPEGWEPAWTDAARTSDRADAVSWSRAQGHLLGDPHLLSDLTGWIDVATQDPERSEEQGRSQVRDSEDSLEVIGLWRDANGHLRLPACAPVHAGAVVPEGLQWDTRTESALARAMASCTLSLPIQLTNPGMIDGVIAELERSADYSGWQQSPWIKGQLILAFDEDDRARLAGHILHYSPDEGLVVTKPEETA